MKKIAYILSIFAGAGLSPKAPGTAGSLLALLLFPLLTFMPFSFAVLTVFILFFMGWWSSSVSEKHFFQRKDPGAIVIDEWCGQWLSLLPALFFTGLEFYILTIIGFILFRFFDILKPLGINRLQSIGGGLGIMIDDVLAGIYAAGLLSLFAYWVF